MFSRRKFYINYRNFVKFVEMIFCYFNRNYNAAPQAAHNF